MEKCAQSMLLDAVCSAQFAPGVLDVFLELHVTDSCDDVVAFSP